MFRGPEKTYIWGKWVAKVTSNPMIVPQSLEAITFSKNGHLLVTHSREYNYIFVWRALDGALLSAKRYAEVSTVAGMKWLMRTL